MKCPNCGTINNDSAKFCKKCGSKIPQGSFAYNDSSNKSISNTNSDSKINNVLIICIAAIICAVIVASVVIATNNHNDEPVTPVNDTVNETNSSLKILGGSFSTGSGMSDKTFAKINLGSDHAGEKVKITAIWSRDGYDLNDGNILTRTISADGYVEFNSLNAFSEYPDHAYIKLYDMDGTIIDTMDVTLNPSSGTQTF